MLEVGRAQKTNFVARYLRVRELQREVNEGLNVMESWNGANSVIHYGRSGEFATNRRDEQEMGAIALHILQAALVYENTLMIQDVLAEARLGRRSGKLPGISPDRTHLSGGRQRIWAVRGQAPPAGRSGPGGRCLPGPAGGRGLGK